MIVIVKVYYISISINNNIYYLETIISSWIYVVKFINVILK